MIVLSELLRAIGADVEKFPFTITLAGVAKSGLRIVSCGVNEDECGAGVVSAFAAEGEVAAVRTSENSNIERVFGGSLRSPLLAVTVSEVGGVDDNRFCSGKRERGGAGSGSEVFKFNLEKEGIGGCVTVCEFPGVRGA